MFDSSQDGGLRTARRPALPDAATTHGVEREQLTAVVVAIAAQISKKVNLLENKVESPQSIHLAKFRGVVTSWSVDADARARRSSWKWRRRRPKPIARVK
jgi:hypothetical protein